jgi:hypothetical protein
MINIQDCFLVPFDEFVGPESTKKNLEILKNMEHTFAEMGLPQFDNRINPDTFDLEKTSLLTEITDEKSAKQALSLALQSRKIKNQAEETKKELLRPIIDYQKAINKLVSDLRGKIEQIEKRLQDKVSQWMEKENSDNVFYKVSEIEVEDGKIFKKESWEYEIVDSSKLPFEYLEPSASAIESAVKSGVRNIPGVRIFKEETYHMRVNNK